MNAFSSYAKATNWLYGLRNSGSKYGIERMHKIAEALGSPQNAYPAIHVAGTNGKGSVCAMLESIYRIAGFRTGLFSSPHLLHQGERIKTNGMQMSEDELLTTINELLQVSQEIASADPEDHPTFFEWMTGIAFREFQKRKVDIAIFETGLGGRLDSTNVLSPNISVITSIGLDHTEILGDTFEKIAFEKGGIIKEGKPVVIGRVPQEAKSVLKELARERKSRLFSVDEEFSEATLPNTNLTGEIQRWNAATAKLTCEVLKDQFPVGERQVIEGLNSVQLLGRWSELQINGRKVILDGAHNEDATRALCQNLSSMFKQTGQKPVIVVGFTGSINRAKSFLPEIRPFAEKVIKVEPSHDRGLKVDSYGQDLESASVSEIFPRRGVCNVFPKESPVLVTGSLYLIAEVLEKLQGSGSQDQQLLQD